MRGGPARPLAVRLIPHQDGGRLLAMTRPSTLFVTLGLAMLAMRPSMLQTPAPAPAANQTNLGSDANGNPLRRALKTGHISNYDANKVAPYTLPDPLVMVSGSRVNREKK